jgi:hypothetical protein
MSFLSSLEGGQSSFQAGQGQNFVTGINNAQTGISSNVNNQNTLAQTLAAQANGQGPNPAQNMLNQSTDNNIKQSAAMMASQKGINPGSTQREAAMNAANQNQTAAGQAATMNSQQQLAAQGALANVYGQVGSEQQANQNSFQNAATGADSTNQKTAAANAAASQAAASGLISGAASAMAMSHGGQVPGIPQVPGDSKKNDIVPTMLSPGEIVVPRSHASDSKNAKDFIDHVMNKSKGQAPGFGEIVQLKSRIDALEKKLKAKA